MVRTKQLYRMTEATAASKLPEVDAERPRFAVLDLGETQRPSVVCGFQGRVVRTSENRGPAVALARRRAARGDVFIVVVDTATGELVFPPSDRTLRDETPPSRQGTRGVVHASSGAPGR